MPKGEKKGSSRKGRSVAQLCTANSITVHHFANASKAASMSGRMKKGQVNAINSDVKKIKEEGKASSELAWYEKDLSDFEVTDDESRVEGEEDGKDDDVVLVIAEPPKKCKDLEHSTGNVYHQDIWHTISLYVDPQDIRLFSRICHGSHMAVHTAKFWFNVYRKYCNTPELREKLPEALQPRSMTRVHGLKSRVIRALFCTHAPLTNQIKLTTSSVHQDPQWLEGAICTMAWYTKIKLRSPARPHEQPWIYSFKFQKPDHKSPCPLTSLNDQSTTRKQELAGDHNIHYNPDDGCCILRIIALNFIAIPPVMGRVLRKTFFNVSGDYHHQKVKMIFDVHYSTNYNSAMQHGTTVILDPVHNLQLIHWWLPGYETAQHTLKQTTDTW